MDFILLFILKVGYNVACRGTMFDIFANQMGIPSISWHTFKQLNKGQGNVPKVENLLGQFASFLVAYKIQRKGKRFNTHFKPGSQVQYLSGIRNVILRWFKSSNPDLDL
jgi:hypothetical protein